MIKKRVIGWALWIGLAAVLTVMSRSYFHTKYAGLFIVSIIVLSAIVVIGLALLGKEASRNK